MFVKTYNQKSEKIGQTRLPSEIFDVRVNPDLLHQVVVSQMANRRRVIAHTKGRGGVRGGGRKPWRQKGTGRARHGSIRSPLWRGGGVTFGPRKKRVFKKRVPKKMKRLALFMALSAKAKSNLIILLDKLEIEEAKTKLMAKIIENLKSRFVETSSHLVRRREDREINEVQPSPPRSASGSQPIENFKRGSVLIVLPARNKNLILAARNLPDVKTIQAKDLNALDLLSFKYLIIPKESIKVIKETFVK